ncbi:hypothetical protein K435DRAFT_809591 [Dendrothele bispora CBS 962.96]|uniref:Uncharacterized protein n=1 Tax=Dendrothele bispora (strain CBS 962.96) TaxID=1314807 RepID=A0A4S8KXS8_DENBC|nr:hypothetical protein K435DRAFT_809591 [Dendrothele bispora CBS 962.96]
MRSEQNGPCTVYISLRKAETAEEQSDDARGEAPPATEEGLKPEVRMLVYNELSRGIHLTGKDGSGSLEREGILDSDEVGQVYESIFKLYTSLHIHTKLMENAKKENMRKSLQYRIHSKCIYCKN